MTAMKKTLYHIGMLAAAALASVACNKEIEINQPQEEVTHVATISLGKADVSTKTEVIEGETSASYKWLDDDAQYLHVYENGTAGTINDFSLNSDKTVATLTVSFTGTPTAPYTYTAKYAKTLSNSKNPLILNEQNPGTSSFDPAADVLVSKATSDVTNLDERATEFTFTMGRVVTVNKMTLTGLAEGEVVSSVEFTLDKHMAGYVTYDSENSNYSYTDGGKKLTLKYTATNGTVASTGQFPVYFVSAPVEAAGIVSVVVTTDQHVYTKSNTLDPNPFDGKTITFAIGTMKRFTMSMSGYGEDVSDGVVYTLVESEDDLYDGATYIIVGTDVDYAVGLYTGGNNHTAVGIEKAVNTQNKSIVTIDNTVAVEPVLLNQVGTNWTIKNNASGNSYFGQYLICGTGTNNRLQETDSESSSLKEWTIAINSGVATIINTNSDAQRTQMYYNQNGTNPMFACYAPGQTNSNYHTIALYVDKTTCVDLDEAELAFSGVSSPIEVAWDSKESFVKPSLTNPHDLAVTYASSDEEVATVDASTGDITFVGNGTTTITASSERTSQYKAGSAEYKITVTGAPAAKGSEENPYTVAEALTIISGLESGAANKTSEEFCVAGIISEVVSFNSTYHSLTYNITADGNSSSDYIQVYSGKGINGANFTSTSDLSAGDQVVVKGYLMKYNTTPEIYQNSVLISRIAAPYFRAELSANTIPYTGGNTITLTVEANVEWTATIDNSASLMIGDAAAAASVSGNADTDVTVIIPQNADGATYTINFSTTSASVSAPANLTITQSDNQTTTVKRYVKVTSGTIDGEYLIVYDSSKYIFDGSLTSPDSAKNYQTATDLSSLDYDDWKDYAVTIESYSTGYSIKMASGKYIGRNANSNGIDSADEVGANYVNTISFNSNGTIQIAGKGSRVFNYNSSSGKFRYFASSNASQIYLYQLQEVSE